MAYNVLRKELDAVVSDRILPIAAPTMNYSLVVSCIHHHHDIPPQPADYEFKELFKSLKYQSLFFKRYQQCTLQLRNLHEAEIVGNFIANFFPNPERVLVGLMELIINAIEHGNLGIGFEEKAGLIANNCWAEEINRRLAMPEHAHKQVEVRCIKDDAGTHVVIKDTGKGFHWPPYMYISTQNLRAKNGRGIAYANLISFDKLQFNKVGNEVTGSIYQ